VRSSYKDSKSRVYLLLYVNIFLDRGNSDVRPVSYKPNRNWSPASEKDRRALVQDGLDSKLVTWESDQTVYNYIGWTI